jgi:uncharacterized short protein YbdD (DUF466 family)
MPVEITGRQSRLKAGARRIWRGIREWCGDTAYERYVQSHARNSYGLPLLSREEFYIEQLQKRYSRVSRCC